MRRKWPRQQRSRETVRAILEASARVLVEDGIERASTNRVAEVAGVSVGSLYQYFPNKDSLLRALLELHLQEALEVRPPALDRPGISLRDRVRLAVEWHLQVHARDPRLHQILSEQAPRVLGERALAAFREQTHALIRAALETHRAELRPPDLDLAVFLYQECLEAMTHGAVLRRPDRLRDPLLLEEMTELLVGFLAKREGPDSLPV